MIPRLHRAPGPVHPRHRRKKTCTMICQPSPQQPRCECQRSTQRCTPPQFLPFPPARPKACGLGMTGTASATPPAEAPPPSAWTAPAASTLSRPPQPDAHPRKRLADSHLPAFLHERCAFNAPIEKGLAGTYRLTLLDDGRGERIRTFDPLVPNQMRYQAALHPDSSHCNPARARFLA